MTTNDPFYNPDDSDKTVMRPRPGGAGGTAPPPAAAAPSAPPQPSGSAPQAPPPMQASPAIGQTRTGSNIITDAAAQLLALIGQLQNTAQHSDIAALHRQVVQAIQTFENSARSMGASAEDLLISRYGLCAAIDETVLNTPWGSASVWSSHSMLSSFHKETGGGEKFFLILDKIRTEPAKNINLIELYSLILSLGFEGKYRIQANGRSGIDALRDELFNLIRMQRGEYERDLSPHWRGLQAKVNSLSQQVPLWVIGALTGVILLCVYMGFNFLLYSNTSPSYEKFESFSHSYVEYEEQEYVEQEPEK